MMTTVVPLKKMLMVSEKKNVQKTDSGIILDGATRSALSASGIVKAIGPDVDEVSVGDEIFLDWKKGSIVNIDSSQYVMISQDDVIAVVS